MALTVAPAECLATVATMRDDALHPVAAETSAAAGGDG